MADGSQMPANPQTLLAQLALQYGAGPGAIPYVQRSQYLARALQQLSQEGQNIKTPVALGANLLAEALDRFSQSKNDAKLLGVIGAQQGNLLHSGDDLLNPQAAPAAAGPDVSGVAPNPTVGLQNAAGGMAGAGAAFANAATTMSDPALMAQALAAHGAQGQAAPSPTAQPDHPLAAILAPQDEAAAVNAVYGEARGEPLAGQQAVAGVIGNRSRMTGQPIADIVAQPHQFAGYQPGRHLDPNSPEYQRLAAAIDPVLTGQAPNPAGNADHFYAPGAMPNGSKPSWDNGTGQMIGHQDFLSLGFGGHPPGSFAQSQPAGPQSNSSADQASPSPRPFQISTGADPSIASPAAMGSSGASPSPVASPFATATNGNFGPAASAPGSGASMLPGSAAGMGAAGAAMQNAGMAMQGPPSRPPQSPQFGQPGWQPPPVPISPQQMAEAQRLQAMARANPQMFMQPYLAKIAELRQQASAPEPLEISRPNDAGQITVTGKITGQVFGVQTPQGVVVAAGPKMVVNGAPPGGAGSSGAGPWIQPVQSTMPTRSGALAPGSVGETDVSGNTHVVQAPQFTPDMVMGAQKDYLGGDAYKAALTTASAVNSVQRILASAQANGGMVDMATMDNVLKAETGLSAKQGGMQMLLEHGGFPNQVQGAVSNLFGQGFVPVSQVRDALNIVRQYGASEQAAAQRELQQRNGLISKLSKGAYTDIGAEAPQIDPVPNIPWLGVGGPSPGSPAPAPAAPRAAGPGSPGWPVVNGKALDPNSQAGRLAQRFIAAGHVWNPRTGDWQ